MSKEITGEVVQDAHSAVRQLIRTLKDYGHKDGLVDVGLDNSIRALRHACRCLWECKIELACVEDEPN